MATKRSGAIQQAKVLAVLMKFRLIINSVKQHYKWVEKQSGRKGAELWALYEIDQVAGLRVSDLSKAMAIQQSTASNLVDKLVKAKLIVRRRSKTDQRVVSLFPTNAGKELIKKAPKPLRGLLPDALNGIPQNSLSQLDNLLNLVLKEMSPTDRQSMKKPLSDVF